MTEKMSVSSTMQYTADLPTQRLQVHQQTARMLRSLLEA